MKSKTCSKIHILVTVLLTVLFQQSLAQSKEQVEDGFKLLFNGNNWDGWYLKLRNGNEEMAKKVYVIEDGMVHVFRDVSDSLDLNTGENNTHGLFYNKKKFSRFILRFEYKWG